MASLQTARGITSLHRRLTTLLAKPLSPSTILSLPAEQHADVITLDRADIKDAAGQRRADNHLELFVLEADRPNIDDLDTDLLLPRPIGVLPRRQNMAEPVFAPAWFRLQGGRLSQSSHVGSQHEREDSNLMRQFWRLLALP
jgi:hypothetical protein